jgi:uncharacterized metal-binding protein YceD (DUF177 family)
MSDGDPPEFSRLVPLARVGSVPLRQEIAADDGERVALARRFGLVSLDRLHAAVELVRRENGLILLEGEIEAAFVQECVITLDPLPGSLTEQFTLLFGPPEAEAAAGGAAGDDTAFEPLAGDRIDIGEAVAQELSLRLPAFPRCPDAPVEIAEPAAGSTPFAALARLLPEEPG